MVEKVWLLSCGHLMVPKSMYVPSDTSGERHTSPSFVYLLKLDDGTYGLIDTGMKQTKGKTPNETWGVRAVELPPVLVDEDDICYRLGQVGLKPDDISFVIITHMHWDHTGGNEYFKHTPFYVQKKEYRYALHPDPFFCKSFMRNHFDVGVEYRLIDGDTEIAPGVYAIATRGHTPGHQAVFAQMADGSSFIFTGDAAYIPDNVEKLVLQNNCYAPEEAYQSLTKMQTLQRITGANYLYAHNPDPEYLKQLPEIGVEVIQ